MNAKLHQHLLFLECGGHRYIYRFISGNERALFYALLETALDQEQPLALDDVFRAMTAVCRERVRQDRERYGYRAEAL